MIFVTALVILGEVLSPYLQKAHATARKPCPHRLEAALDVMLL
jgi:hypothetical protein